ncbi:hypothetical protein QRD40_10935 [Comamonas sp. Y6]|uniref:Uncharacterized protein n=1 Tax=Comamonas resistens TaxID=3046670 RepID=A0ABY8SX23_9BURK|nr:hypothetical protein [Comamonas resistens]MDL5036861.1 hypothetical protein [Comamonas resistens]WHS67171.1 hypothetical protein QMY55_08650 [Comamonas resistens]
MRYAYIESGVVVEVARVDPFSIFFEGYASKFVEVPDNVEPGYLSTVDGYIPAPVDLLYPRFVGNEKLDLFTQSEQLAVVTATMTDPIVKLLYDRMIGAAYMSYEDPETEQGLALLESKGLLTPERKAEIVVQMQPA